MANEESLERMIDKVRLLLKEEGNDVVEARVSSKKQAGKIRDYFQTEYDVRVGPSFSDDDLSGGRIEYLVHISRRG